MTLMKDTLLLLNTAAVLDEEKRTSLIKILQCPVCFEIPEDKQVHVCEQGHHFCSSCHKKLQYCGICRGKLLKGRNFVVEELVKRFKMILGPLKHDLLPMDRPVKLTSKIYKCQHQCDISLPAFKMLPHIRKAHSENLIDGVRANPYTKHFSWAFNINFQPNESYPLSVHISDIGLFTVYVKFTELDLFSCIKILGDETVSSMVHYQLIVKIQSTNFSRPLLEFSITDCPVACYNDEIKVITSSGNFLQILGSDLIKQISVGSTITVFFSIWKNNETKKTNNSYLEFSTIASSKPFIFSSDRKIRRNKNRSMRRKRLKEKHKMWNSNLKKLQQSVLELVL